MPKTSSAIRYGRNEMTQHSAKANGQILAGDVVVEQNGGDTVGQATSSLTNDRRYFLAIDDRERGMEIGDAYSDGENVQYVALSEGAGINVNMEDGQTLDPTSETRLVMSSTDGRIRPFNADNVEDTLFETEEESSISASGSEEPVSAAPV